MRRNRRRRVSGKVDTSPESSQTHAGGRGPRPSGALGKVDRTASMPRGQRCRLGLDVYDQEHEAPATARERRRPLGRRGGLGLPDAGRAGAPAGARAGRAPSPKTPGSSAPFRLKALAGFATVPRMATTEAPGFAARARQRQRDEARAKARRARRTAALVVVAAGCLVALLLIVFGRNGETVVHRHRARPGLAPAPRRAAQTADRRPAGLPAAPAPGQPEPGHRDRLPRERHPAPSRSSRSGRRRTPASPSGSSAGSSAPAARTSATTCSRAASAPRPAASTSARRSTRTSTRRWTAA